MDNRYIVIFDGVCVFCNGAVRFIIKRDPESIFTFSPMQSEVAQSLIKKHHVSEEILNSLMLIKNGRCYLLTYAILEIANNLSGFWYLLLIFNIIHRSII